MRTTIEVLVIILFIIMWNMFPKTITENVVSHTVDTTYITFMDTIELVTTDTVFTEHVIVDTDTIFVFLTGEKVTERTVGFDNNIDYAQIIHKYLIRSTVKVYGDSITDNIYVKNDILIKQLSLDMLVKPVHVNRNIIHVGAGIAYNSRTRFDVRVGYERIFSKFTAGIDIGVNSVTGKIGWRF